jgi:hypothetical protein
MASDAQEGEAQKIQIFPTSTNSISPFWREKYEREAKKYWDIFYKRHQDRVINNSFPYHYQLLITNTAFYHIIHVFLSSVFQR